MALEEEAERLAVKVIKQSPGFKECVAKIKEIDGDDAKYAKMQSEPLISELEGSVLDPTYYASRIRTVLDLTASRRLR